MLHRLAHGGDVTVSSLMAILAQARQDARIPPNMLSDMAKPWDSRMLPSGWRKCWCSKFLTRLCYAFNRIN